MQQLIKDKGDVFGSEIGSLSLAMWLPVLLCNISPSFEVYAFLFIHRTWKGLSDDGVLATWALKWARKGIARYPVKDSRASLCKLICNQWQVITHCFLSIDTRNPWENNELQLMTIKNYCLMASLIAHSSMEAMNTQYHNVCTAHIQTQNYILLQAHPWALKNSGDGITGFHFLWFRHLWWLRCNICFIYKWASIAQPGENTSPKGQQILYPTWDSQRAGFAASTRLYSSLANYTLGSVLRLKWESIVSPPDLRPPSPH